MPEDLEDEREPNSEGADEDEAFLLPYGAAELIDSAIRLAHKLLEWPGCSQAKRETLEKALFALGELPKVTPKLAVEYGFSYRDSRDDLHYWSVYFDETELKWSAGGYVHGPAGGDSYTSFQFSLFRGGEDSQMGGRSYWFDWEYDVDQATSIEANDYSPEPDVPEIPVVRYQLHQGTHRWVVVDEFQLTAAKSFPKLTDAIACVRFAKIRFSTYDDCAGTEIECPNCGEINVLEKDDGEYSSDGLSVACESCPCALAVIHWPTRKEAEAAGDRSTVEVFDIMSTHQQRFQRSCLKSPDQLPDIENETFTLEWDLEDNGNEVYTLIKHKDKTIFKELAFWEGGFRYGQVAKILKEKYGARLTDVIPTPAGWFYLEGDGFIHRWDAEMARKELFGKTG